MAGSFPGSEGPSVGALSGPRLAHAIALDPTATPAPTEYQGHQPVVIQTKRAPVARTSEGIPVGELPYVAQFDMRYNRPEWSTPMALPAGAPIASEEERAAAEAEPVSPAMRGGGVGVSMPSGYGAGPGGYYAPDYLSELVRARNEGRITEKQFDTGTMAYNKAMTGTSMGLELAAGRQEAALAQRGAGLDVQTARAYADAQAKENEALGIALQKDEERAAAFEERRQQFLADSQRRQNEYDALTAEIRSTKIDPNAYWANRNGFSTMLSLFAVGLGGYVEGKTGGRVQNKALGMVENAIDRDIQVQKANLDTKKGAADMMRGGYAMARQRFGDEQAAEDYSRALLWDQFAKVAQRYKGEARSAELGNAASKLEMQASAISRQFENKAKVAYMRADEARRAAMAQAAAGAPARELKLRKELAEIRNLEAQAGYVDEEGYRTMMNKEPLAARYVPEAGAIVASPTEAKELRDKLTASKTIAEQARAAAALVRENPVLVRTPGTEANVNYNRILTDLKTSYAVAKGQGAMAQQESALYGAAMGETNFLNKAAALEGFAAQAEKSQERFIKGSTAVPVDVKVTPVGQAFKIKEKGSAAPRTTGTW